MTVEFTSQFLQLAELYVLFVVIYMYICVSFLYLYPQILNTNLLASLTKTSKEHVPPLASAHALEWKKIKSPSKSVASA